MLRIRLQLWLRPRPAAAAAADAANIHLTEMLGETVDAAVVAAAADAHIRTHLNNLPGGGSVGCMGIRLDDLVVLLPAALSAPLALIAPSAMALG